MALQGSSNWFKSILFFLGLIATGATFWLAQLYLEKQEQLIIQKAQQTYLSKSGIVVASQDLVAGTYIEPAHLAAAESPNEFLPVDIITPDNFNQVLGLELQIDLPSGAPLINAYLGGQMAARFSDTIPVGYRALTIDTDSLKSNENMIEVGDRVDLMHKTDQNIALLAEQIRVIATGSLRSASQDPNGSLVSTQDQFSGYQSLTLLLKPELILPVFTASQSQQLIVLLRNSGDLNQLDQTVANMAETTTSIPFISNKTGQGVSAVNLTTQDLSE